MKQYEKLALLAVVLLVVGRVATVLIPYFSSWYFPDHSAEISSLVRVSAAAVLPIILAVNIGIACWLYCESKKDNGTPWIWFLFGFMFQLTAVAVFFILKIYHLMQENKANQGMDPTR